MRGFGPERLLRLVFTQHRRTSVNVQPIAPSGFGGIWWLVLVQFAEQPEPRLVPDLQWTCPPQQQQARLLPGEGSARFLMNYLTI